MSLRKLSTLTGRNRGYLSHLERGHIRRIADDTGDVIAKALKVPTTAITDKESS